MEERGARAIFFSISTFYKLETLEVYIGYFFIKNIIFFRNNNIGFLGSKSISTHVRNFKSLKKLTLYAGYFLFLFINKI